MNPKNEEAIQGSAIPRMAKQPKRPSPQRGQTNTTADPGSQEKLDYRPLLEIEEFLTQDQRRTSVGDHLHFIRSMNTDRRGVDDIDRAVEELASDPIHDHLPAYKSKSKISRLDSIFAELERGAE